MPESIHLLVGNNCMFSQLQQINENFRLHSNLEYKNNTTSVRNKRVHKLSLWLLQIDT